MDRPPIPAGHDRIELVDDKSPGATWRWRKVAANNEHLAGSGESFSDKTAARRAAERANGVTFPEDQDWVDVAVVQSAAGDDSAPVPLWWALAVVLAILACFASILLYDLGYNRGHDAGYDQGYKAGFYKGSSLPGQGDDVGHESQSPTSITVTTTTLPVCGDYNHDGQPDSPSGDPPLGQERQVPPSCTQP